MTCVKVTLTDIAKWFPKPTSQKMHIHPQLVALLSNAGCTWPPNADCFGQCSSFKLLHCSGKQQLTVPLALLLQDQHTSCVSDSEEYDVHADKQISSSQTLASSSGDESSCSAAHLPGFSAEAASLTANLEPLATQDGKAQIVTALYLTLHLVITLLCFCQQLQKHRLLCTIWVCLFVNGWQLGPWLSAFCRFGSCKP